MNTITLCSNQRIELDQGQTAVLTRHPVDEPFDVPVLHGHHPGLSVGTNLLERGSGSSLRAIGRFWLPGGNHALQGWWLKAQGAIEFDQVLDFETCKEGMSLAWITLSDKGFLGEREDRSGPMIESRARRHLVLCHAQGFLIPDSASRLKTLLTELALSHRYDLILTSGGTGVGPRDITPEATAAVLEKELPGFERAMTAASLSKTPHGMISRARAGVLGSSLIVNLPGSSRAVEENLEAILPAVRHTIEKLQGDTADCGRP